MIRYAGIPSILFLVMLQWSLAAGGLALAGRRRRPQGRSHWLAGAAATVFLGGAFAGLVLMPGDGMGSYRTGLLGGVLAAIFCWGRIALLPLPGEDAPESTCQANRRWAGIAIVVHLSLTLCAAYWYCDWFVVHHAIDPAGIPLQTFWMALSVVLNRLSGAILLGYLAVGAAEGFAATDRERDAARLERIALLAQKVSALAGWRMVALCVSLALGIAAGPLGRLFLLHEGLLNDALLIGVRILVGIIIPGFLAWLAERLCAAGETKAAAQQFPPALIMALIGEVLGAGLTFGLVGLGF